MLVLSRKKDEEIFIGKDIRVFVIDIKGDKVRLGIEAPNHVSIYRAEVLESLRSTEFLAFKGSIK